MFLKPMRNLRCLLILLIASAALAQNQSAAQPHKRPRIALVLEGGGALGFAHIGAIEYLEEHHIPVDFVAGTSMGGLVGGLYASGMSPEEIRKLVGDIQWNKVLSGETPFHDLSYRRKEDKVAYPNRLEMGLRHGLSLPSGLNSGHEVGLILDKAVLPDYNLKSFDDLPIPFRCVATNMSTRGKKVFDHGSLAEALRATMSIPGVFVPTTINGEVFTDGAAVDNLPVDVAKQAGADIVIAVYLDAGPPTTPPGKSSWLTTAGETIAIMVSVNELQSIKQADILLSADLKGFAGADFNASGKIIPKGYEAAEAKQSLLDRLSVNESEWAQYLANRNSRIRKAVPEPQFVRAIGTDAPTEHAIEKSLAPNIGKPIDPDAIARELTRSVGYGTLYSAGYTLTDAEGKTGLLAEAYPKNYGPPFLNLGITIDGSDYEDILFGLGGRITFNNLGGYRSEWRTDAFFGSSYGIKTEYYHPLTAYSPIFVAPHGYSTRTRFDLYSEQSKISQFVVGQDGGGLDVGYMAARGWEFRLGEDWQRYTERARINFDNLPTSSEHQQISSLKFNFLGTDNTELPRSGTDIHLDVGWHHNDPDNRAFTKAELTVQSFLKMSPSGSAFLRASGGSAFGVSTLDLDLQGYTLGGPFHLGSYGINELLGNQYFLFQTGYEYRLIPLMPLVGEGVYGMLFVEGGKMYDNYTTIEAGQTPVDGTMAIVARTALGPVFIGGSIGSAGHRKWWFGLRHVF